MNAMIFSAGLGSRLRPFTNNVPKALIKVNGKPLIQIVLESLVKQGFDNIVVNVHHHADAIEEFLENFKKKGLRLNISREEKLLDTGGGLKKAIDFFDKGEPVLLHNVDVITNLNLNSLIEFARVKNADAALAVRARKTNRYLLFNSNYELAGWENVTEGKKIIVKSGNPLKRLAFSGVTVVSPLFLRHLPNAEVFPLVEAFLKLTGETKIIGYEDNNSYWFDVGTPQKLKLAEEFLKTI